MPKLKIRARVLPDGHPFVCRGQEAKTLLLLVEKGPVGVVAFDFRGGPPFRLPAYTWALNRSFGLAIDTLRESHDGGWHGRFVLRTPVEILTDNPERAAA